MRINWLLLSLVFSFFFGCGNEKQFYVADTSNNLYSPNTTYISFEDLSSPKVESLKIRYQIDTVFHEEKDEFQRMLLLRDWIRKTIRISDFEDSYPGKGSAEGILDAAIKGQGFHCGHYMNVQNAVQNAYGYVTRCLGAGPGVKGGPDFHHGVNEIWSNKYVKWFLSDAKYNHHFEKNGIPLSALEIRDAYLKNKAEDISLVKGVECTPIEFELVLNREGIQEKQTKTDFAQVYTWIAWERANNKFTREANDKDSELLCMYADEYYNHNIWIRDDQPYWAYGTEFLHLVEDRKAIEWTPNLVFANANIEKNQAHIQLTSNTPNLLTYQMKGTSLSNWTNVQDSLTIKLSELGDQLSFRTVNMAGVTGPESHLNFEAK